MAENAKELTKEELAELTPMMQHYLQTKEQYPKHQTEQITNKKQENFSQN